MDTERSPEEAAGQDYLEELRAWYADQCERSSVRSVAAQAGIGRTTMHGFISARTTPHPRVRRLLVLYRTGTTDDPDSPASLALLIALAADLPPEALESVVLDLLGTLEREVRASGREVPSWLTCLQEGRAHDGDPWPASGPGGGEEPLPYGDP